MTEDRLPHRLTVVWFTDLVGYSSLMAQDEDRAIASRDPAAPQILEEPALAPLRSDPRFTELKRKLGL